MRNIKFRGKFLDDTSEWLYGNYVYIEDDVFQHKIADKSGLLLDIDINTLGQFTELKDENGKEIYEGDIVLIDAYTYTEPEFSEAYLIEYNELLGMWELKNLEDNKDIKTFEDLNGWYKLDIELLGNKWDNPELLEKGEQ